MGISLKSISEGCCKDITSMPNLINGEQLDSNNETCDMIIECKDKYILVEEKSLFLGFFNECCKLENKNLGFYKSENKKEITDELIEIIHNLDNSKKNELFSQNIASLLMSSLEKVSTTTHILSTKEQFDNKKAKAMPVFYLYCDTNTKIDAIAKTLLRKYTKNKKQIFIECKKLIEFLNKKGCNR